MRQSDINLLGKKLKKSDFSNLDNPLYDFSDKKIESVYQKLQEDTKPKAISRDTTSWDEIKECVENHISQYGDEALIIIAGAAPHIWGAIPYLEGKVGARYVSATTHKLSIDLVASEYDSIFDKKTKEKKALDSIQVQIKRDLEVARKLGYDTIEDYITDRSNIKNPRNIIFGAEETGHHTLYFGERDEQLHTVLLDFIRKTEPTSLLYIHEDLNIENMKIDFKNNESSIIRKQPIDKIFDYAKSKKMPVEFGAFGHRDRQSSKFKSYPNGMIGVNPDIDSLSSILF